LRFPEESRDKHLYVCGATGTGKSKFLENLIKQDIKARRKSGQGLLLLDPHGSLYDNLMDWLAWNQVTDQPIIPIDLRRNDWIIAYNMLRRRETAADSVVVDNFVDSISYVWGENGTLNTPLLERWAGNIIRTLYENNLTLVEATFLLDREEKQLRAAMTEGSKDKLSRNDWKFAGQLTAKDFDLQISSTVNRLQRFIHNRTMRAMFGQDKVSLDLGKAIDEGAIILVSLATAGAQVSKNNAELFATLLLSDLWTAAQERGKRDGVKPFAVYMDEFQRFVSPTIADNLDEARGFGLRFVMGHQFPNQLLDRGENGVRVYNSIMENASSKVVFRLSHEDNLRPMAQWLFMGIMDPEEIKHQLYSTKVLNYREEYRKAYSRSSSEGEGWGENDGSASGTGLGGTESFPFEELNPTSTSLSEHSYSAQSRSRTASWSRQQGFSESEVPVNVPQFGRELSHVQFRSLEEQLFRAMAVLFDQKQRQGVARLVGMRAPVSFYTPNVDKFPTTPEMRERYVQKLFAGLDFAIPMEEAERKLIEREKSLPEKFLKQAADEPVSAKKSVRSK
jgi:hypothetical protein